MTDEFTTTVAKPRLGFVGLGWIGLNRMKAILDEDGAVVAAIGDPNTEALRGAQDIVPSAASCDGVDGMLTNEIDAIVIATPSGLHAEQTTRALSAGKAVFCQKPLGRTAEETKLAVETARRTDRLLGVDFSYRHTKAMQAVRAAVGSGEIGTVYAADLTFHNAYGPANAWANDPILSGGGCVIDLGIHLIDALLWTLGDADVHAAKSALFRNGRRLDLPSDEVEDFAQAQLDLSDGATARLTCSWHSSPGCDSVIEVAFHGSKGSLSFRNLEGSFYDFAAELHRGAHTEVLVEPPDAWSGRAALEWVSRLAESPHYDAAIEDVVDVARVIDLIYQR